MRRILRDDVREKERHNITFTTTLPDHRKAYQYYKTHGNSSEYIVRCILLAEQMDAQGIGDLHPQEKGDLMNPDSMGSMLSDIQQTVRCLLAKQQALCSLLEMQQHSGSGFLSGTEGNALQAQMNASGIPFEENLDQLMDAVDEFDNWNY